jgi:hypothetical protein
MSDATRIPFPFGRILRAGIQSEIGCVRHETLFAQADWFNNTFSCEGLFFKTLKLPRQA